MDKQIDGHLFQWATDSCANCGVARGAYLHHPHRCSSAPKVDIGDTSDGYHTFNELYEHRIALFMALMNFDASGVRCWRSFKHHDGSKLDGWFIAGMDLPTGTITYHLPEKYWDDLLDIAEPLDRAPEWDKATSNDTVKRLRAWIGL